MRTGIAVLGNMNGLLCSYQDHICFQYLIQSDITYTIESKKAPVQLQNEKSVFQIFYNCRI